MLRSLFPSCSPSRSPSPVPTSSSNCSSSLGSSSNPSSTSTSRSPSRSPSPFSLSASFSKSLPPLPAPTPTPAPAPGPDCTKPQPKNKISSHRLHQLTTLLTLLNLTQQSLQREQDLMVSILEAATTHQQPFVSIKTASTSRPPQDIDLLALASNACRAKRYRGEEPTSLDGVTHWQGVVDELGRAIERLEAEVEGLERERRVLEESW